MNKANNKKRIFTGLRTLIILTLSLSVLTGCGIPSAAGTAGENSAGTAGAATETAASGTESMLEGQWNDETAKGISLDVWRSDDGIYHGRIINPVADIVVIYYEFTASGEKDSLSYSDGTRTDITYNEDWEATEDIVYSDATGKLELKDDAVYWTDDKEDLGAGLKFVR